MQSISLRKTEENSPASLDGNNLSSTTRTKKSAAHRINIALWIIQVLLACLFLFAGGMKLVMPMEEMAKGSSLPGCFFRFIGVAEVLGGLGLVLPGLTGILPVLTPLASAGLTLILVGAVAMTASGGIGMVIVPLIAGILTAFVTYGRTRLAPHRPRSAR